MCINSMLVFSLLCIKVQNIGAGLPPDAVLMGSHTLEPVTKFTFAQTLIGV